MSKFFKFFTLLFSCFIVSSINTQVSPAEINEDLKNDRINLEVKKLKEFALIHGYNSSVFFLIDLKIPSKKYRFFVYDAQKNSIVNRGLTSHGSGSVVDGTDILKFSNISGSLMTSLGKYEIQGKYYGQFGKAFRLRGLDKTNNNALKRYIVLHGYRDAWEKENGTSFYLSWGCPMVAPPFLELLDDYISNSEKPLLLHIFY